MLTELGQSVEKILEEGYGLWSESGIALPNAKERHLSADALAGLYDGEHAAELAAACQCFYYFRRHHAMTYKYPEWATLLGDYFFSQFSQNLISLDSVALTDAFADYLRNDTLLTEFDSLQGEEGYLEFIRRLPAVLK